MGIVGPSGCGKSSILNIISGLDKEYNGKLLFKENIKIGYMFQEDSLFPWLTVLENSCIGIKDKNNIDNVIKLLDKYGLSEFKNSYPNNLSGGMRQRVALIRTLGINPDLLLLDEPAAGMNPNETMELAETIKLIRDKFDMTILLIDHDLKFVSGLCDRVTVLNFGTVLADGNISDVLNNKDVIEAYIGKKEDSE